LKNLISSRAKENQILSSVRARERIGMRVLSQQEIFYGFIRPELNIYKIETRRLRLKSAILYIDGNNRSAPEKNCIREEIDKIAKALEKKREQSEIGVGRRRGQKIL